MSIFGKIKNAIFGRHAEAAEPQPSKPAAPASPAPAPTTIAAPTPPSPQATVSAPAQAPQTPAHNPAPSVSTPQPTAPQPSTIPAQPVDVAAIMDKAVKDSGQNLNWRTSIVDTMKALHLDSSLSERKELAQELGYTGDMNDSATMNVWLQKALMKKLAENGGQVPAELTD